METTNAIAWNIEVAPDICLGKYFEISDNWMTNRLSEELTLGRVWRNNIIVVTGTTIADFPRSRKMIGEFHRPLAIHISGLKGEIYSKGKLR